MSPQTLMGASRRPGSTVIDSGALVSLLGGLYHRQLAVDPKNGYLIEHSQPRCISNQVRTFRWYEPYLPATGAVLDWGCQHAPDSCLLRAAFGTRFELHGCDFVAADRYPPFYEFANFAYKQLDHISHLPYPAESFAAVIGSGVLEHVAMDYESLKELHRILKPGGIVVLSYLPNWLSYEEWLRRVIRRRDFHRRLYGLHETQQLLKHTGFYPRTAGYHTFFWERWVARLGLPKRAAKVGAAWLSALAPVQVISSTLCFAAEKVTVM